MKQSLGMLACVVSFMLTPCVAVGDDGRDFDWPPPTGIGRGVVNIVTSPGEIVRDISFYGGKGYEAAAEPGALFGGIAGVVPGAIMCVARIGDGVLDCFTLGIWGSSVSHVENLRDFFPTFFWDDLWLPESLSQN